MTRVRARLEYLRLWRQVAAWAPVVWFPVVVYTLLTERTEWALALGLAGLIFAGLARGVVWSASCPACAARFRASASGFRRIWDAASCEACGLSLFELRRHGSAHVVRAPSRVRPRRA